MHKASRTSSEAEAMLHTAVHQKNIPGLDAMRASAILMVVLYHWGIPVSGALGVIVFFVLSGFLITGMLIKEHGRTGTIAIGRFYGRRAFRIFPAFYLCWIVTIILILRAHAEVNWKQAFESFFYLADYGRALLPLKDQITYPMGVSWSLAVEEQFYLLWPLTLLWILKRRRPAVAVAWIIATLWVWRAVLVVGFHVSWDYAYNAFDTRADALMVGCWLALILFRGRFTSATLRWLSSKWLVLFPVLGLAVMNTLETRGAIHSTAQVVEFTVAPVLIAILLLQWIYWGLTDWTFLEHPFIKFIARISYSLYLYHGIVFWQIPWVTHLHHANRVVTAALCLILSAASYYGIERPFMQMRDRGRRPSVLLDDGLKHESGKA
jgi:peptidoglycan/LPS O-acetylase OafA/YrhL